MLHRRHPGGVRRIRRVRHRPQPGLEAMAPEHRQAQIEQLGRAVAVLARDAVAPGRQRHRRAQVQRRRPVHVLLRRFAQPAGRRDDDGAEHRRRVLAVQRREHCLQRAAPGRRPGPDQARALGRRRQRRAQQHDAEIGVAADRRAGGAHRRLHPLADTPARRDQRPDAGACAGDEVLGLHAVAGRMPADIARLAHRHVPGAGVEKGLRHHGGGRHARRAGTRPAVAPPMRRSIRSSTSACAIGNGVTRCSPRQAATPLTSSTQGRPSGPGIRSTPA